MSLSVLENAVHSAGSPVPLCKMIWFESFGELLYGERNGFTILEVMGTYDRNWFLMLLMLYLTGDVWLGVPYFLLYYFGFLLFVKLFNEFYNTWDRMFSIGLCDLFSPSLESLSTILSSLIF